MSDTTCLPTEIDVKARMKALRANLKHYDSLAIAISGGVDSTTLAAVAHDVLGSRALMVHAVSPAVPHEATERVQAYATRFGWAFELVDANEFADDEYRRNPVDRCYYCKSSLYQRIHNVWEGSIASGANLDDLGDYRPGLLAAKEKSVVHPLIDAGIDKACVRAFAALLKLESVAELPAQPCLSSRIETGIAIDAKDLAFVHRIELFLNAQLGQGDHRCRITAAGVRIEVPMSFQEKDTALWQRTRFEVTQLVKDDARVLSGFSTYQRGSAFLKSSTESIRVVHKST